MYLLIGADISRPARSALAQSGKKVALSVILTTTSAWTLLANRTLLLTPVNNDLKSNHYIEFHLHYAVFDQIIQ